MTIKYTYPRGNTTIYQRAIPTDLRNRYKGLTVKHDLKTADPVKVARLVSDYNRRYEAEWNGLRAAPDSSPESLKAHGAETLRSWGLKPGVEQHHDDIAVSLLYEHLDAKRERYAKEGLNKSTDYAVAR